MKPGAIAGAAVVILSVLIVVALVALGIALFRYLRRRELPRSKIGKPREFDADASERN